MYQLFDTTLTLSVPVKWRQCRYLELDGIASVVSKRSVTPFFDLFYQLQSLDLIDKIRFLNTRHKKMHETDLSKWL